jgi:hypothetical protein
MSRIDDIFEDYDSIAVHTRQEKFDIRIVKAALCELLGRRFDPDWDVEALVRKRRHVAWVFRCGGNLSRNHDSLIDGWSHCTKLFVMKLFY